MPGYNPEEFSKHLFDGSKLVLQKGSPNEPKQSYLDVENCIRFRHSLSGLPTEKQIERGYRTYKIYTSKPAYIFTDHTEIRELEELDNMKLAYEKLISDIFALANHASKSRAMICCTLASEEHFMFGDRQDGLYMLKDDTKTLSNFSFKEVKENSYFVFLEFESI